MKLRSAIFLAFLALTALPVFSEAYGHSMFNSAEQYYGGYRVQVATLPEFPQIDEQSQILVRITDRDLNEVDRFTMGIRFFYNDQQIDAIQPRSYEGGHSDFDHVWRNSGNHVVKIDLYDMKGTSGILTYTFNMGTQSPFGIVFFMAIIMGVLTLAVVVTYIYIPKKFKRARS